MLFDKSGKAKRRRELKNELKELQKTFVAAGCDKAEASGRCKELGEIIELGETLCDGYRDAREHLSQAREAIPKLLDCMGESPVDEVEKSLQSLMGDLEQVYHDCSIREDDGDFASTVRSLKKLTEQYAGSVAQAKTEAGRLFPAIMLRSELENVKAVLDDAAGWSAPDFVALAYFFRHEDRALLKEMENEQRNSYVYGYWAERFEQPFAAMEQRAGRADAIRGLAEKYVLKKAV